MNPLLVDPSQSAGALANSVTSGETLQGHKVGHAGLSSVLSRLLIVLPSSICACTASRRET